jgi:hypothetical protein|tara:strand:- start:90 stop:554 length:465 start_codon:yes stop_codon:yes gene_type:complete
MQKYNRSFQEGTYTEEEFISLRKDNFVRRASRTEDIHEHWDVLDKEFGKVDIKAPKRQYRNGPIDYSIHWWEFKNVTGKPGWGTPNNVERFIAFRIKEGFVLVDPQKVNSILEDKCTSHYRGLWGLNTRKNRKDLAAMIPVDFLLEHCEHRIEV